MSAISKIIVQTIKKSNKIAANIKLERNIASTNTIAMNDGFVSSVRGAVSRSEMIAKVAQKHDIDFVYARKEIEKASEYFDGNTIDRLLKLADEGQIKLLDKPKVRLKRRMFDTFDFTKANETTMKVEKPILDYLEPIADPFVIVKAGEEAPILKTSKQRADFIKQLLNYEKDGKLPADRITSILDLEKSIINKGPSADITLLIKAIEDGSVNPENIDQAILLMRENYPLELMLKRDLKSYTVEELKKLREILAAKGTNTKAATGEREQFYRDTICKLNTPTLPASREERSKVLTEIEKLLTSRVKVNNVSQTISQRFLGSFDEVALNLTKTKPILELQKAGGIGLKYSRNEFKSKIMSEIEHLSESEQKTILSKFGLAGSKETMTGLPVYLKDAKNLSDIEKRINSEIGKFLNENEIILPKGFEEYKAPLEEICATFPEFRFSIGVMQHKTQSLGLAEHMLSVFKSNIENPLYKTLNESDRKILGISTLLHDINKTEGIVDKMHPITSSESVNAIVQRMNGLTVAEKNRIINLVENHHWLEKIAEGNEFSSKITDELALKFRSGNDFTMAKIFAESDLKGVNSKFFSMHGGKINSPMVEEIEKKIFDIQRRGYSVFTADVGLEEAIKKGAIKRTLGTGAESTENYVIKAKDLGLDKEAFLYHAPATDDAFIMAQSGFGYGNEGVFSLSMGKNGQVSTFQNRKEFWGFRQPQKSNVLFASRENGNTGAGKDYTYQRRLLEYTDRDFGFSKNIKIEYKNLSNKELLDSQYAKIFRELESIKRLNDIHTNKKIIEILGGQDEANALEKAIEKTQNSCLLETGAKDACEFVAQDLEPAFIGTKRTAEDISYNVRRLCNLIVEFD